MIWKRNKKNFQFLLVWNQNNNLEMKMKRTMKILKNMKKMVLLSPILNQIFNVKKLKKKLKKKGKKEIVEDELDEDDIALIQEN